MTLKEKFEELIKIPFDDEGFFCDMDKVENCEKIADDYAIEFAEWSVKYRDKNKNVNGNILHSFSKYDETYLTKELLEIFKKEKGL
jgi:hypothetical protein